MTEHAKNQLAMAIFTSQLVGDESLHVGQFMVKRDNQGVITDLTRIDFGARERYAVRRESEKDFTHATSHAYNKKWNSQVGNDYISYLLAHPDINARVMQLWARPIDTHKLAKDYEDTFVKQYNNLPQSQQAEALKGVQATINKGAKHKFVANSEHGLAKEMSDIMKVRVESLKKEAKKNITQSLDQALKKVTINSHDNTSAAQIKPLIVLLVNARSENEIIKRYDQIKDYLGELSPPAEAMKVIAQLESKIQCESLYNQNASPALQNCLIELKDLKVKYQILSELKDYSRHLDWSMQTADKELVVKNAISTLTKDLAKPAGERGNIQDIINDNLFDVISKSRREDNKSRGGDMAERFRHYLCDYKPPQVAAQPLAPSRTQRFST